MEIRSARHGLTCGGWAARCGARRRRRPRERWRPSPRPAAGAGAAGRGAHTQPAREGRRVGAWACYCRLRRSMSVEPRRAAHVIAAAHSPPSELPRVAVAALRAQNQRAAVRRAGGLLQAEAAPSSAPHVTKGRLTFGEDSSLQVQKQSAEERHTI